MPRVGVISDTHGLRRPEAVAFLRGSDRIVHAGDIGNAAVLTALAALAPVTAVRGNNDYGDWADGVAETATLHVDGVAIYVVHDVAAPGATAAGRVRGRGVGHSHKPAVVERDGVLYVNPERGPRFRLPIAVAELAIAGGAAEARLVELTVG
jgi:putative phosphoesterase